MATTEKTQSQQQTRKKSNILLNSQYSNRPLKIWNKLTALEQLFYCKQLDVQKIQELLDYYSQIIEYYDCKKDPISQYFQEKIQFILSRKEVLNLIINQKKDPNLFEQICQQNPRESEKVFNNPSVQNFAQQNNSNFHQQDEYINRLTDGKDGRLDTLDQDLLERPSVQKRKIQYDFKMNMEIQKQQQAASNMINTLYDDNQKRQDLSFKNDLDLQQEEILKKLQNRKNKKKNQKVRRHSIGDRLTDEIAETEESQLDTYPQEMVDSEIQLKNKNQQSQITRFSKQNKSVMKEKLEEMQLQIRYSAMRINQSMSRISKNGSQFKGNFGENQSNQDNFNFKNQNVSDLNQQNQINDNLQKINDKCNLQEGEFIEVDDIQDVFKNSQNFYDRSVMENINQSNILNKNSDLQKSNEISELQQQQKLQDLEDDFENDLPPQRMTVRNSKNQKE